MQRSLKFALIGFFGHVKIKLFAQGVLQAETERLLALFHHTAATVAQKWPNDLDWCLFKRPHLVDLFTSIVYLLRTEGTAHEVWLIFLELSRSQIYRRFLLLNLISYG